MTARTLDTSPGVPDLDTVARTNSASVPAGGDNANALPPELLRSRAPDRNEDDGQPRGRSSIRDYIRELSKVRFWLSKWIVAGIVAGCVLVIGLALLLTRNVDFDTFLNYFALGLLLFVVVTLFYGIIAIHDVPYEIAVHRDHPHQDAIHAAGWVSLFTLHAIWPFLWIWAMLYRPERGWGFSDAKAPEGEAKSSAAAIEKIERRMAELESRMNTEIR
jgi:Protein of unknown function (DUF3302)